MADQIVLFVGSLVTPSVLTWLHWRILESGLTMFLKHVSNWNVRALQKCVSLEKESLLLFFRFLSYPLLDFHSLILPQQHKVLFTLRFLRMVSELLAIFKEDWDWVVKPLF